MLKEKSGKRTLLRAAIALVAPLLMTIMVANGTANAAWRNGELYNLAKAQCLDGGGGWVSTWSCNGSSVQIWVDQASTSSPYYQPRDNAGQCLDAGQGNGLFGCIANDQYQEFTVEKVLSTSDGRTFYRFRGVQDTSKCLDGGQSHQSMWFPCNGGNYQLWSWA
ncbi:MAG TPA: hypothetical protein VL652_22285 [Kutzneria sp.]|jgi:hypothetical protein|nr:hypothetical protein [Kutzneria sp.]